jgi:hypothetical protein
MPMYTATFLFLGLAGCIVAAMACLTIGKRATRYAQVDMDAYRLASVCLSLGRRMASDGAGNPIDDDPALDDKSRWRAMKTVWMNWYSQCQEKATAKQKVMYSWARTLSLCAILCLVGVLIEAKCGHSIMHSLFGL